MNNVIVTAGANYLGINVYACMMALSELIRPQEGNAIAEFVSAYKCSVCPFD